MLGKQWLNRYIRHTGGSIIERCGDRQRKFNGLEKWQFRLFIEGLPIMLQLALFLLACGLSRYMWSVSRPVAGIVISFTLLGFLFYVGIVIAGISSYECPFQTPVSIALRRLKESGVTAGELSMLPPLTIIFFIPVIWRKTRKLLVALSSLIYAALVGFRLAPVSTLRHTYSIMRRPSTWEFSLSQILSGIHDAARNVGHRAIILLLEMDRKFGNAKQKIAQKVRRLKRAGLLPTFTEDANHEPVALRSGQGLRVHGSNLEATRRQNMDDAACVSWVLRNITDPEALDAAIRLAGTIRWFDSDSGHDPHVDVIVSTFEACFDSSRQPYPGMRDRAYFSARAILQITMRATTRSREHASKYPIPILTNYSTSFRPTDPDLNEVIRILMENAGTLTPTLPLPKIDNTPAHSLWLSNLLVDLARTGSDPVMGDPLDHFGVAEANHRPTIANVLIVRNLLLGGRVEEETFWVIDKSYAACLVNPPSGN